MINYKRKTGHFDWFFCLNSISFKKDFEELLVLFVMQRFSKPDIISGSISFLKPLITLIL
jgi:hypothetical protein